MGLSTRLQFTYMAEGAAGNAVSGNTALDRVELLIDPNILDRDLTAAPGSPADGDQYILAGAGSGAWSGHGAGEIAYYKAGWYFATPKGGMQAYVKDEGVWIAYSSTAAAWKVFSVEGNTAPVGGFNAALNLPIWIAPEACTIVDVFLHSDLGTSGSVAGTTDFTFQVRNVGTGGAGTTDMRSAVKSTGATEITAWAPYALGLNQNLGMAKYEGLQLRIGKNGAPTDLTAAKITCYVVYKKAA